MAADNEVGRGLGDVLVWLTDHITVDGFLWFLLVLAGAFLLWQVSLVFGPQKVCWRCKGNGHVGGLLGGRRDCLRCGGVGRRKRIGAK